MYISIVSSCSQELYLKDSLCLHLNNAPLEMCFGFCQRPQGNIAHDHFNQIYTIYWQNEFWHQICLRVGLWLGISGRHFVSFLFFSPLYLKTGKHPHCLSLPDRIHQRSSLKPQKYIVHVNTFFNLKSKKVIFLKNKIYPN